MQSASLLHLGYGRRRERKALAADPFYALSELFSFAADSEAQFLNMLESDVQRELDHPKLVAQRSPTLSNLLFNQQALDRHVEQVRQTLTMINERSWSQPTSRVSLGEEQQNAIGTTAARLSRDFQALIDRAQVLSRQCERGMQVVMYNTQIKEARQGIEQAEEDAKLTRLAFVFIPLSFTTSLFGMNVKQFGTGTVPIGLWFAVSIPAVLRCFLLLRWNISRLVLKASAAARHRWIA